MHGPKIPAWAFHLGGFGLIPVGLMDSSIIPLPGSMDILTVALAAQQDRAWPYYALMATLGSVAGGYITYRLARKQGKDELSSRLSKKRTQRVTKMFEKWGVSVLVIPAILPPPMPMVPFVLAAGAMQYSTKKFLLALTVGRAIRFSVLAFLADRYGGVMIKELVKYGLKTFYVFLALCVVGGIIYFARRRATQSAAYPEH